jgi:hypothetical protein
MPVLSPMFAQPTTSFSNGVGEHHDYGIPKPDEGVRSIPNLQFYNGPQTPLSLSASTSGSVAANTAWRSNSLGSNGRLPGLSARNAGTTINWG